MPDRRSSKKIDSASITEIIMQNEDTVKKYGIAKIVIVVQLAGIQIVVFKRPLQK
jgi:hypothetical protein